MAERGKNRQILINMIATFMSYIVNMGISVLLTPFIVGSLGAAAYGFVGLSNNVLGYTQLLTIALNSMAGRFITIKYTQGKIDEANKYFSSVFYCNLVLSIIILVAMSVCVIFFEKLFDVPEDLVFDVKALFSILTVNTIIGLMSGIYGLATFVKNRLELTRVREIIGSFIRVVLLLLLFGLCPPRLWYLGITAIVMALYITFTNYRFTRLLTPELRVNIRYFDVASVKELVVSGSWNVLVKIGELFGAGLDMILVNVLVGATAMGLFSISRIIPTMILSIMAAIAANFAPVLTQFYAKGQFDELKSQLQSTIRIQGSLIIIPCVFLSVFGEEIYSLWMPSEDAHLLWLLALTSSICMNFSMPLEALWNIFTITNKLKVCSICMVMLNIVSTLVAVPLMHLTDNEMGRVFILIITRSSLGLLRSLVFLPIYGSMCLNYNWKTFYPQILKTTMSFAISCGILYPIHYLHFVDTWIELILTLAVVSIVSLVITYILVLSKSDKIFIKDKVLVRVTNKLHITNVQLR